MKFQKYPSINGLRAISILLVVIYHLHLQYGIFQQLLTIRWLRPVTDFLYDGHLGVNVFFVISGFLITSLMLHEEQSSGRISLKNFYLRRTLRIFPAYYTLLLIYFIFQILGEIHLEPMSWITSLTYTKYFNWLTDWYTSHAWSLSIEEHFYLFWPMVFLGGEKTRKYTALALVGVVLIIRTYTYYQPISWMNDLTIFARIDAISIGCLAAMYKDAIISKLRPYWTSVFLLSCATLLLLRYFPIIAAKVYLDWVFIPLGLAHGTLANVLIAIIMMYSVFGSQGIWFKFLNLRILNYIGILSYSIYLWQQPFIYKTNFWINQMPQNLLFVILFALGSYYLIEKPFLRLKAKFSDANG